MRVKVACFDIEVGSLNHRVGRIWIPDGLHIWVGSRGVHLYWKHSVYERRVAFDRLTHKGKRCGGNGILHLAGDFYDAIPCPGCPDCQPKGR